MKDFQGKVAVITGAASGIGRGLADYCSQEKMKIVLADVERGALSQTGARMKADGAEILTVLADVSKIEDVQSLARKTIDTFGKIDLLFNNAGVAAGASIWESSINDCNWVVGVNLWGVIHCIREFVPIMLRQGTPCHIVNTSSMAGFTTYHPSALYQFTKHGIIALSEQLFHDLKIRGANIKVSVLCPGPVNTNIMDAERNRPEKYKNCPSVTDSHPEPDPMEDAFREMIKSGMSPSVVAGYVFKAIKEEKFYIMTHPEMKPLIQLRMDGIMEERNPLPPPGPS